MSLGYTAYATIEAAETYFTSVLDTEPWDDAEPEMRQKALYAATRMIDGLRVRRPHSEEKNFDEPAPTDVQRACAQIALDILDGFEQSDFEDNDLIAEGYGNIRDTHDSNAVMMHRWLGLSSYAAFILLRPYLEFGAEDVTIQRV